MLALVCVLRLSVQVPRDCERDFSSMGAVLGADRRREVDRLTCTPLRRHIVSWIRPEGATF